MPKRKTTKAKISVTIDKDLREDFYAFCRENAINKSQLVEKLVRQFLEEKKK